MKTVAFGILLKRVDSSTSQSSGKNHVSVC